MTGAVSKVGVVPCRAASEKSMDNISGISYYLNKMLAVIKHVVDDNTAHACTIAWCVQ